MPRCFGERRSKKPAGVCGGARSPVGSQLHPIDSQCLVRVGCSTDAISRPIIDSNRMPAAPKNQVRNTAPIITTRQRPPRQPIRSSRLMGDYPREVGPHPVTALEPPRGRRTPYAWMWQLGSERIVGNSSTITSLIDLPPKTSSRRLTIRFLFAYTDWHAGRT